MLEGADTAQAESSKVKVCAAAEALDYSKSVSWSILTEKEKATKAVDVFYVYPTVILDPVHPVMDISIPSMRKV